LLSDFLFLSLSFLFFLTDLFLFPTFFFSEVLDLKCLFKWIGLKLIFFF